MFLRYRFPGEQRLSSVDWIIAWDLSLPQKEYDFLYSQVPEDVATFEFIDTYYDCSRLDYFYVHPSYSKFFDGYKLLADHFSDPSCSFDSTLQYLRSLMVRVVMRDIIDVPRLYVHGDCCFIPCHEMFSLTTDISHEIYILGMLVAGFGSHFYVRATHLNFPSNFCPRDLQVILYSKIFSQVVCRYRQYNEDRNELSSELIFHELWTLMEHQFISILSIQHYCSPIICTCAKCHPEFLRLMS